MTSPALDLRNAGSVAKSLYRICKPGVVALIVFTAAVGIFLAAGPQYRAWNAGMSLLGIALIAGASGALNAVFEGKRDARMRRTRSRPVAARTLGRRSALLFAIGLGGLGLLMLGIWANMLTVWLGLATLAGYAFVYTLLLKPRTPQNIVWGGLCGAMPPVLGWAAATDSIKAQPLLLFLIIFLWTPPHFWALALHYMDDYRQVRLPMMPVARGEQHTKKLIICYSLMTAVASMLPQIFGFSGWIYGVSAAVLGLMLIDKSRVLYRSNNNAAAMPLFHYSIAYLFLLFLALVLDHIAAGS